MEETRKGLECYQIAMQVLLSQEREKGGRLGEIVKR